MNSPKRTREHLKHVWVLILVVGLMAVGCTMPVQSPPPPVITAMPQVTWASPYPTPASRFDNYPPGALITVRAVGSIPANTPVQVTIISFDPAGGYTYGIITLDQQQSGQATDKDLAVAAGYQPGQPTPAPRYDGAGYTGVCYALVTTDALQLQGAPAGTNTLVPPGTRVRVSTRGDSAAYLGNGRWTWFYSVTSADQPYAALAREDQLAPAPGMDPTLMAGPTPTQPYPGVSGFDYITKGDVGAIPGGTTVRIGGMHIGCAEWIVSILTQDGRTADVSASQIEPAPGFDPNAPTPAGSTPFPTP